MMGTKKLQSFPRLGAAVPASLVALGDEGEARPDEEPDVGTDTETEDDEDRGADDGLAGRMPLACTAAIVPELTPRRDSVSRFSRFRSARISAAP